MLRRKHLLKPCICSNLKGIISKESPLGKAVMGRRAGDRAVVKVNDEISYGIRIVKIEKGQDDDSLPISAF